MAIKNAAKILLVEDDYDIMRVNRTALEMEGYRVIETTTLKQGRAAVEREEPDLIVLDILLPDGNGIEYCKALRGSSGVRILFLSALNTKEDIIAGLRAGGDDYISKPYLVEELLARVEVLLRRSWQIIETHPIRLGGLEMRPASRIALLDGEDMMLTSKEFAMLELLVKNQNRFVPAQELYEKIWGTETIKDVHTVRVRISNIRRKLNNRFDIKTGRYKGYRFIMLDQE